jgi:hypothetical protein
MKKIAKIPYLKIVEQADKTPDAVAVLHGKTQLSYTAFLIKLPIICVLRV